MELKTCFYCKKVIYNDNLFEPNKLDFHWSCAKAEWYKNHLNDWSDLIRQLREDIKYGFI